MNKSELVARLAAATGLSKAGARRALDALFDPESGLIVRSLRSGQTVSVAPLGMFRLKRRAARRGRNPQTGEAIRIPPSASVRFRPSRTLKDALGLAGRKAASKEARKASPEVSKSSVLVKRLAATTELSTSDALRVIETLFDAERGLLVGALRSGEPVSISPFGKFSVYTRAERQARNPQTGQPIRIPSSLSVRFRPSSKLKDAARTASYDAAASPPPSEATPELTGMVGESTIAEPEGQPPGGEAPGDVRFTAYHPKEIKPLAWYPVLAYAHLPDVLNEVHSDSRRRLGAAATDYGKGTGEATAVIKRGAEITVVPELPRCRFNPKRASFTWLKDWHRAEFEVQANPEQQDYATDRAVNGRMAFYVGPVLVGEVNIWAHLSDSVADSDLDAPGESATSDAYRRIFVSYAHRDAKIVEALERAYKALGDTYLRDVKTLRAGEAWNSALLKMIESADIFQLCWSAAARQSRYVRQEYLHALEQRQKEAFIRPTYWEVPMPTPPSELASLHFAYLKMD